MTYLITLTLSPPWQGVRGLKDYHSSVSAIHSPMIFRTTSVMEITPTG